MEDREVAGLRCREILQVLSEYVDGVLPPARVAAIEAHLAGCDWCTHFGGRFSEAVERLRREMNRPSIPDAVRDRLRERLRRDTH